MYFSGKFIMMKKTIYFLLTLILFITGCSEKTDFTLKAQIEGLPSDTLLAYFQIPEYKIDTIICQNGMVEYSFTPDTMTVFTLLLSEDVSLPIYAEKGETVEVKGSIADFSVKGKGDNQLMNDIMRLLRNTTDEEMMGKVDSLIQTNSYSFTNLYLIDKYYTRSNTIDYGHLEELIERQSGIIKDTPYILELQKKMKSFTGMNQNQSIHVLTGKDREGKDIQWPTNRDNYILIDFWASWHPESMAEQDSLVNVLKELKKENFLVFSISLDLEKDVWMKASDRDTTQWRQVCDFKGWNNSIVKSQNIYTLPANLLLDKNKRIIARNIRGQELVEKVKGLIREDKEREKERASRKRKR